MKITKKIILLSVLTVGVGVKGVARPINVFDLSTQFHYRTAMRVGGHVIGWLVLPQLANAVLICSKDKYFTVSSFAPRAAVWREHCNYRYINPDLYQLSAPKGLYFWLNQVMGKRLEIGNFMKGTLLRSSAKDFPEYDEYRFLRGGYYLRRFNTRTGKKRSWDESTCAEHPFICDEKGIERFFYSSMKSKMFVKGRLGRIKLAFTKLP